MNHLYYLLVYLEARFIRSKNSATFTSAKCTYHSVFADLSSIVENLNVQTLLVSFVGRYGGYLNNQKAMNHIFVPLFNIYIVFYVDYLGCNDE